MNAYLYDGGPLTRTDAMDESGATVRTVNLTYGPEGETLARAGSAEAVSLTYDAAYRTKTVVDGNGRATTYAYDLNGRPTEIDYPLASGTAYDRVKFTGYDPVGNLLGRTDGNGQTTTYAYADLDGLLSNVTYPGVAGQDVALTYDAYDRLTSWTDGTGAFSHGYDDGDRLIASDCTYAGQPTRSISYVYWPDGSRHEMVLPGNYHVYTNYDAVGRWAQVNVAGDYDVHATYYDNGWQASRTVDNGLSTAYSYNAVGALAAQTNAVGSNTISSYGGFGYDGVFNLTGMSAAVAGVAAHSGTVSYAYDAKDRLTGETSTRLNGYSQTHAYDAAGNPTTLRNVPSIPYDADNRRTGSGFAYDGNGSPTTYAGASQGFDPEARLTSRGTTWAARYRADGLRAWKSVNGTKTYFLYDEATGDPAEEYSASGGIVARDAHAPDGLIGQKRNSQWTFYAYDPQGSVAQRTTSAGSVTSSAVYDAYGAESVSGTAPTDPFGYNAQDGYYLDRENGLYYCEQRYYDPSAGRWVTRDPIDYEGGINLYGYCESGPVGVSDPEGLEIPPPEVIRMGRRMSIGGRAESAVEDQAAYRRAHPGWTAPYQNHGRRRPPQPMWTNCATFVKASVDGADPDLPAEGTDAQGNYLRHSDRWRELGPDEAPYPGDVANMPPPYVNGHRQVGHTMIYSVDKYGKGRWYNSSLGDRGSPKINPNGPGRRYRRYRRK